MKILWEESDIHPGRIVQNLAGCRNMIGNLAVDPDVYTLITLETGMVESNFTKQQLADELTRHHYAPVKLIAQLIECNSR